MRHSIKVFSVLLLSITAAVSQQVPNPKNSKPDVNSVQQSATASETDKIFNEARFDPISRAFGLRSSAHFSLAVSDDVCAKGYVCCKLPDRAPGCMTHHDCGYYGGTIVSDDKCK